MATQVDVTLFNDPGCPWGYSANPALRVLEWRYGAQLRWRLVLIGLTEDAQQYVDRGYDPLRSARGNLLFRRYGMPIAPRPRERMHATSPACRAVVAARLDAPGSEWAVHRALQFVQFTTDLLLDDVEGVRGALARFDLGGADADRIVSRIEDDDVREAYDRDRAEARTAAGRAGAMQGKTANTDGAERYTAPSVLFEREGVRLEAAGFQPVEAYDVLLANLDPTLERRAPATDVREVLAAFPGGLVTQEVAAVMTAGNDAPDRVRAEHDLLGLLAEGGAQRLDLGDDALWVLRD